MKNWTRELEDLSEPSEIMGVNKKKGTQKLTSIFFLMQEKPSHEPKAHTITSVACVKKQKLLSMFKR